MHSWWVSSPSECLVGEKKPKKLLTRTEPKGGGEVRVGQFSSWVDLINLVRKLLSISYIEREYKATPYIS